MSDAYDDLTAEYERLMAGVQEAEDGNPGHALRLMWAATRHILRRLGPPSLTEASEIERREAIAADGE